MRVTGGVARGLHLRVPGGGKVRPTSDRLRGALFQLVGEGVLEAVVLDLYAGTGSLGVEALSRGASRADFVERDALLCRTIRQNLETTGFSDRGRVYWLEVDRAVETLPGPYDLVLLDPPYRLAGVPSTLNRLSRPGLLTRDAIVVIEHSGRGTLDTYYRSLRMEGQRRYGDSAVTLYGFHAGEV